MTRHSDERAPVDDDQSTDRVVPRPLFSLLAAFSALLPPSQFSFSKDVSSVKIHDFILSQILLNPLLQQYPPSKQYQSSFWKQALQYLEQSWDDEDAEIDSRIYVHYLSLVPSAGPPLGPPSPDVFPKLCPGEFVRPTPPAESYLTYFWLPPSNGDRSEDKEISFNVDLSSYKTITLKETRTLIEGGTTGLHTWPASFVLAQYLINRPELVLERNVLELGSGVGFLGIIIASLQVLFARVPSAIKYSIWLTDINDFVLSRCLENTSLPCNLSFQHPNIRHQFLDWNTSLLEPQKPEHSHSEDLIQNEINPDIILGADIVFDPDLIPALLSTLQSCLRPSPSPSGLNRRREALIALALRNQSTMDQFQTEARDISFSTSTKGRKDWFLEQVDGSDMDNVHLFRISRKE